jgi:hypothetical protein
MNSSPLKRNAKQSDRISAIFVIHRPSVGPKHLTKYLLIFDQTSDRSETLTCVSWTRSERVNRISSSETTKAVDYDRRVLSLY